MDLLETLKLPEGKTLEFKRDLSSRAGILRTVIAFANTAGGTLVLGVEDGTRHVRGVPEPLSRISDCVPFPEWLVAEHGCRRSLRSAKPYTRRSATATSGAAS